MPMQIKSKDILIYVVSFLLAIIFLYIAFQGVEYDKLLEILSNVSYGWIAVIIIVQLLSHYVRAFRWKYLIGEINKPISVNNLFGSVLLGYGVNNVTPKLGEVAKAVAAGRLENISKTRLVGTIFLERTIDLLLFAGAVFLSAFLYHGNIYTAFPWLETAFMIGGIFFLIATLFMVLTLRFQDFFLTLIIKIIAKISSKLAEKIGDLFKKFITGFNGIKTSMDVAYVVISSAVMMLLYAIVSYFGFYALGMQDSENVTFAAAWIIMSISAIGNMIPTPGGIGSYHTITKSVLIILFGFNVELSIAYATLTHGVAYFVHLFGALGFFLIARKKFTGFTDALLHETKEGTS